MHHHSNESQPLLDQHLLRHISAQLRQKSLLPQTDMGEAIYEWIDHPLDALSSFELSEILHLDESSSFVNSCLVESAKRELLRRSGATRSS